MRLLIKRELWLQAAVIATLYPVVAFAAALGLTALERRATGPDYNGLVTFLVVLFWSYIILVPLLSWLLLVSGVRLLSGGLALLALPIFPITAFLLVLLFRPLSVSAIPLAAALNIAVGALGFHSIFKRQAASLQEWRAKPRHHQSAEPA